MKKLLAIVSLIISFGCVGCDYIWGKAEPDLEGKIITISEGETLSSIADAISPAVVAVSGTSNYGDSVGSGVCVANGGYVLTNSHVVNGFDDITLYLADKSTASASVIYEDTVLDFAILKCNRSIPYLRLGESDDVRVGEDVLAVGTPLSLTLTHTFTKGIVSAVNRTIKVSSTEGNGYMQNLIQHDASLNPGNSGGPLINAKGEVVGINTLKISGGEGIGFAIPTKSFISLLSNFVTNINYRVPYLGVYGYDSEIASYYGESSLESGFYIIDIAKNSPLNDVDIVSGAVITKIGDRDIGNTLDLKDALYTLSAVDSVAIEYYMGGKLYKTRTKLTKN